MPDLSALLNAYANQLSPGPTPSFATVERKRRRRRGMRLGSAAVALAVTGTLGLTWLEQPSRRATTADAIPVKLVIDGVTLHRARTTAIVEVQAASPSATTLTVDAGTINFHPPTQCSPWTDARVLSETDTTITLAATLYEDRAPMSPGSGCSLPGYPPQRLTVPLRAPLGNRTIVQDDKPLPVRFLDTLLLPIALPVGYADSPKTNAGFYPPNYKGSITRYAGRDANADLEVFEVPLGGLGSFGGQTVGRSMVRGHAATIVQDGRPPASRCLRWDETATTAMQVCSQGNPAPLTVDQLKVVAESLTTR